MPRPSFAWAGISADSPSATAARQPEPHEAQNSVNCIPFRCLEAHRSLFSCSRPTGRVTRIPHQRTDILFRAASFACVFSNFCAVHYDIAQTASAPSLLKVTARIIPEMQNTSGFTFFSFAIFCFLRISSSNSEETFEKDPAIPFHCPINLSLLCTTRLPIIRPKPLDEVLQNPNTGITTFNRFNGQATNPELKWSEVGPVAKVPQAASKPDFPDTTIAYLRWYWNALEPERGNSLGHY